MDFTIADSLRMARCSAAAYPGTGCPYGAELLDVSPLGIFRVYRFGTERVIAFRGTSNLAEWLTDARCKMHESPPFAGRIHDGFAADFEQLKPWLARTVETCELKDNGPVWLTGHSLGGARATLAAQYLEKEGVQLAPVYTFGAPRVGNAAFKAAYSPTLFRVVDDMDCIAHLPPAGVLYLKYRHVGTCVTIGGESAIVGDTPLRQLWGWWKRFRDRPIETVGEMAGDHCISGVGTGSYIGELEALEKRAA